MCRRLSLIFISNACQFVHFDSCMSIHVNPFMSVHSFQFLHFKSFISIHSFHAYDFMLIRFFPTHQEFLQAKLVPVAMSYYRNFRPSVCRTLPGTVLRMYSSISECVYVSMYCSTLGLFHTWMSPVGVLGLVLEPADLGAKNRNET